ncbi:hypothetical protein WJX72_009712 [[Myrmecia] bisecta]|uniref:Serine/threonine-protein kinase n=1 Tax=[Myrmecia] bisecta TaxID=41462 RepID=A0AAW1PH41_9CHLO
MELEEAEEDAQARELKKRSKSKRVNVDCPEVVVEVYTPATGLSSTRLYINRGLLGRGGFAAVYDVQRLDDSQVFAAKAISKASLIKARSQQKLQSEISIHAALCHPNIVQFVQSFEDAANVYLLLERCNGCTIADLVKRQGPLAEHDAAVLLEQMLSALVYLHDRLIIHRDLKLSNLFMTDEGRVKLGDFGLACQLATPFERKTTVCGTPNFIAPEVLRSKNGHGLEADIWSLGVVLYTMLVGRPPFETPNVKMTYSRIRANAYCFPTENPVSAEATDLIRSMLRLQPERRPSLDQIRNHAFFARFRPSNRQTSMPQPQRSTAFNDHTSLVMAESSSHYLYIVHPKTRGGDGARRHEELRVLRSTGQNQLPAALAKKVSLLHHFKAHMPSGGSSDQPADASAGAADPLALRYVKQWLQAGRAIVFRFSTRAVQVEFTDGSEILLSGSAHTVCYHAKGADSPAATYCLDKLPADGQLLKRLKYTRELLPQLVQGCRGLLAAAV